MKLYDTLCSSEKFMFHSTCSNIQTSGITKKIKNTTEIHNNADSNKDTFTHNCANNQLKYIVGGICQCPLFKVFN